MSTNCIFKGFSRLDKLRQLAKEAPKSYKIRIRVTYIFSYFIYLFSSFLKLAGKLTMGFPDFISYLEKLLLILTFS